MFSIWSVSLLALLYLGLLFIIAWWADKYNPKRFRALFYSLTLGVYCTSWAFSVPRPRPPIMVGGFHLLERAPGVTIEEIRAKTVGRLHCGESAPEMTFD
nr:hypothetical protein [Shewanella indica]